MASAIARGGVAQDLGERLRGRHAGRGARRGAAAAATAAATRHHRYGHRGHQDHRNERSAIWPSSCSRPFTFFDPCAARKKSERRPLGWDTNAPPSDIHAGQGIARPHGHPWSVYNSIYTNASPRTQPDAGHKFGPAGYCNGYVPAFSIASALLKTGTPAPGRALTSRPWYHFRERAASVPFWRIVLTAPSSSCHEVGLAGAGGEGLRLVEEPGPRGRDRRSRRPFGRGRRVGRHGAGETAVRHVGQGVGVALVERHADAAGGLEELLEGRRGARADGLAPAAAPSVVMAASPWRTTTCAVVYEYGAVEGELARRRRVGGHRADGDVVAVGGQGGRAPAPSRADETPP